MSLSTLAAQVTAAGISAPTYAEILQALEDEFRSIYGSDAYIAPDSQDGQYIAIQARAIYDANQMAIAVYNSFSPSYAQGTGLSSLVKINGLRRLVPTQSTATGIVIGQTGTQIINGAVQDDNGNLWDLPLNITIPLGGEIEVTVTARDFGNVTALSGTINTIATPTLGWQSFMSTSDATPGAPLETDAALRRRQALSTALPSVTPLAGMISALENLTGVTRAAVYENDTNGADANGLPEHSISVVIEGGDLAIIGQTIGQKKTPGAATYGTTTVHYVDPITGIGYDINFFVLDYAPITVDIELDGRAGYNTNIAAEIQAAIADYVNALVIGDDVEYSRLWGPAYLNGLQPDNQQYHITSLLLNGAGVDVVVPFNQVAKMAAADVTITVNP